MPSLPGRILLGALICLGGSGCYLTRSTTVGGLRQVREPVMARLGLRSGEVVRALITPGDVGPASIRYRPLRFGPESWVVRFGGWPMVYTAGKYLRRETMDGTLEVPLDQIRSFAIEEYSWPLTLLTLPLTLPVGIIDFLIHHIRFGFDEVDTGFDTFSKPPASRGQLDQIPREPRPPPETD